MLFRSAWPSPRFTASRNWRQKRSKAASRSTEALQPAAPGASVTVGGSASVPQAAGVKALVLNHIVPPLPAPALNPAFLQRAGEIYRGPLRIGTDGDWFTLPAGTTAVEMGRRP